MNEQISIKTTGTGTPVTTKSKKTSIIVYHLLIFFVISWCWDLLVVLVESTLGDILPIPLTFGSLALAFIRPYLGVVLLLIVLFQRKKIPKISWIIAACLVSVIYLFFNYPHFDNLIMQVIGSVVSIIAIYKYRRAMRDMFGPDTKLSIMKSTIIFIIIATVLSFAFLYFSLRSSGFPMM